MGWGEDYVGRDYGQPRERYDAPCLPDPEIYVAKYTEFAAGRVKRRNNETYYCLASSTSAKEAAEWAYNLRPTTPRICDSSEEEVFRKRSRSDPTWTVIGRGGPIEIVTCPCDEVVTGTRIQRDECLSKEELDELRYTLRVAVDEPDEIVVVLRTTPAIAFFVGSVLAWVDKPCRFV